VTCHETSHTHPCCEQRVFPSCPDFILAATQLQAHLETVTCFAWSSRSSSPNCATWPAIYLGFCHERTTDARLSSLEQQHFRHRRTATTHLQIERVAFWRNAAQRDLCLRFRPRSYSLLFICPFFALFSLCTGLEVNKTPQTCGENEVIIR